MYKNQHHQREYKTIYLVFFISTPERCTMITAYKPFQTRNYKPKLSLFPSLIQPLTICTFSHINRNHFDFFGSGLLLNASASTMAARCAYGMVSAAPAAASASASACSFFRRHNIKTTVPITKATQPATIPAIAPGLLLILL